VITGVLDRHPIMAGGTVVGPVRRAAAV